MPLVRQNDIYDGVGKVYLRDLSVVNAPWYYVGGTSKLETSMDIETKSLPNNETTGGGDLYVKEKIKSYKGATELYNFSPENIAMAVRGTVTEEDAATVTDEAHTALTKGLVLLNHLLDPAGTVTASIDVTDARASTTAYAKGDTIINSAVVYQATTAGTSAASAPTFTATLGATTADGTVTWTSRGAAAMVDGTDYAKVGNGLEILSARFALRLPVKVDYTQNPARWVQLLAASDKEYGMAFNGLNDADGGNPLPSEFYRVKFSPTSGLGLKTGDFGKLPLNFTVLPDTTKAGTGISQYGRIGMAA